MFYDRSGSRIFVWKGSGDRGVLRSHHQCFVLCLFLWYIIILFGLVMWGWIPLLLYLSWMHMGGVLLAYPFVYRGKGRVPGLWRCTLAIFKPQARSYVFMYVTWWHKLLCKIEKHFTISARFSALLTGSSSFLCRFCFIYLELIDDPSIINSIFII